MRLRRRYIPSARYNVCNTGRFKLRKQIWLSGQTYRRIEQIAPYYYVGRNGEVVKYDPNTDRMKRVDVRRDMRVRLFPGEGDRPIDARLDYLVALAWKPGRHGRRRVLHKNGNAMDCRAGNLMWADSLGEAKSRLRVWVIEERRKNGTRARYSSLGEAVAKTGNFTRINDLLDHIISGEPFPDGSVFHFKALK